MDLKWLEDLLVLLETKSFTRSAAIRHVTQPAFSRRIRLLEDWLGVALVDRSTRPISVLTRAQAFNEELGDIVRPLTEARNKRRRRRVRPVKVEQMQEDKLR